MNSFIDSKISKNYFMSNLIFVYGTLRWSESRNSVLSDSEYLGLFQSCSEYTMVDLGSFPGIFKQGNNSIIGEIYNVSKSVLEAIDRIESHPDFYKRKLIKIQGIDNVSAYFLEKDEYHSYPEIKSGDWLRKNN